MKCRPLGSVNSVTRFSNSLRSCAGRAVVRQAARALAVRRVLSSFTIVDLSDNVSDSFRWGASIRGERAPRPSLLKLFQHRLRMQVARILFECDAVIPDGGRFIAADLVRLRQTVKCVRG